jgi:hypothetical protein
MGGGNFLFVEVDHNFRNDFFRIEEAYKELLPHSDGRPKATKFICSYRTLEHIDFDYFLNLYYCNSLGNYIELESGEFDPAVRGDEMRILIDLAPLKIVCLTRRNFIEYGEFSINPESYVSVPSILYTQVNFDIDGFLSGFEENPFIPLSIPGIHPARMRDAILELRGSDSKKNKGISLNCPFDKISYRALRRGFMFSSLGKIRFYPLIPMNEVEKNFYKFWKSM